MDDFEVTGRTDFQAEAEIEIPPEPTESPEEVREALTPLQGLTGSSVPHPDDPTKEVEANVLIGDPTADKIRINNAWVIAELDPGESDVARVNVALALAWAGYLRFARGDGDGAAATWDQAIAILEEKAQHPVSEKARRRLRRVLRRFPR